MKFCHRFYEYLYVDDYEKGFYLCPWMEKVKFSISLGNLKNDDIEEAYNGDLASHLRSTMDDQSFKYCRIEACPYLQNNSLPEITLEDYNERKKNRYLPTIINLAYDSVCNQYCETCRPEKFAPPKNYAEQMNIIHAKLKPYLNNAKMLTASGRGDPFASKYMMNVLENLHPTNPKLSILLETNGVYFDEEHWERIKHLSNFKIDVVVTTNSFDETTYSQISRGGNFEKVIKNLDFMSELRKKGDINVLSHSFVIQDKNFREIPSFIKRSFDDYAFDYVLLKPVYLWRNMSEETYWLKDVLNPCHPAHDEYLEVMKNPLLKDPRVFHFAGNTVHKARPFPDSNLRFPYSKINRGSRIIIYGAGKVGQGFMEEIKETQYCEVVAWIDKNADGKRVMPPETLAKIPSDSYDYILIASMKPELSEAIEISLKKIIAPPLPRQKFIFI